MAKGGQNNLGNSLISEMLINGLDWSKLLDSTTNKLAEFGKGYTAEGGVISKLSLPTLSSAAPPQDGDEIGVSADENSSVNLLLDITGDSYMAIAPGQSVIFRYDKSKVKWLVVASHLPVVDETIDGSPLFTVNGNAASGGDGSVILPFNTISEAITKTIGTGTAANPQYRNVIIKVVAGSFTATTNYWVESTTIECSEGVEIDFSGAGYNFDNSTAVDLPSSFKITGDLAWTTSRPDAGFIKAKGTSYVGSTSTNNSYNITATFNSARNIYANDNANAIPLIHAYNHSDGDNAYMPTLVTESTLIQGYDIEALVKIEDGAIWLHEGGAILQSYANPNTATATRDLNRTLSINGSYLIKLSDVSISGTSTDNAIDIGGNCTRIEFTDVTFPLTGSSHSYIRMENHVVIKDNYLSTKRGSPSSNTINGIIMTRCVITSANFNNNGLVVKCESSTTRRVDFVDCSFVANIDPNIIYGYLEGSTVITPTRINVIGGRLVYHSLPTEETGLSTGSLYQKGGVLCVVGDENILNNVEVFHSNIITFKKAIADYFGTKTTPRIGTITLDGTDAVNGGVAVVNYKNPTLDIVGNIELQTGEFAPNIHNKLYIERDSEGLYYLSITNNPNVIDLPEIPTNINLTGL